MPITRRPSPDNRPPRGVPRWLWPPPGAEVETVVIVETADASGRVTYAVRAGEAPASMHLRALQWLLDEHTRAELPAPGTPFEGEIVLEIARTAMERGRVGHAYALNGGPLGDPGADGSRGVLWRFCADALDRR